MRTRWVLRIGLACPLAALAVLASATGYHLRGFRTVEPGVLYRSGQLTPTGMRFALQRHGIKTVVTLRTVRDPDRPYLDAWEEDVCAEYGARHVRIVPRPWTMDETGELPAAHVVREFLAVMDDPANHPVLVHCYAGVHRTGTVCAIYRMEYQGWPADRAIREMEVFGFHPGQNREAVEEYLRVYRPRN